MSRAWMPMYWGDYLRDTRDLTTEQHGAYLLLMAHYWEFGGLPNDDKQLATIAGLSLKRWRNLCQPVQKKFGIGWTHKRIDKEIARAEQKIMQRAIAGRKGGQKSGLSRSYRQANAAANGEAKTKHLLPSRLSKNEANGQAKSEQSRTNHNHIDNLLPSTEPPAREEPPQVDSRGEDFGSQELQRIVNTRGWAARR